MKRMVFIFGVFVFFAFGIYGFCHHSRKEAPSISTPVAVSTAGVTVEPTADPLLPSDLDSIRDCASKVPLDTVPSSYTALVNRDYLLPSDYVPTDLTEPNVRFSHSDHDDKRKLRKVAANALEKMFHAAEKKKIILCGVSGYRSYQRQKSIYQRNVALHGKKATDALSAKPGSSEHQTGLTIDVSAASVSYLLSQRLAQTKEGKWIAKNAHKYGFIVRYPKGKAKITSYSYEPWHIRYVGVTVATYLYKNKLTLEEYYGVTNQSKTTTGVDVEDPDKYESADSASSPALTPSPKPTKNN